MIYALDTNIISYFIKGDKMVIAHVREALKAGDSLIIPPIVYYEARRGLLKKDARKQGAAFDDFCKDIPVGKMSRAALDEAAMIYAGYRGVKRTVSDADILIAAFCLVDGYTLVTNNIKDFRDIQGLQLVDWTKQP